MEAEASTSKAASPPASMPPAPGSRRGRGRGRVPPLSIQSYHTRRGYFSVTDLVGPLWCEQAFTYNILGMGHLPVAERPATITLPSGKVLQPDRTIAERREEIQVQGREVHAKLEREIHPIQVYVQTKTEEDDWALRLLRLVIGLRSLLDQGCVRELPIVGWVRDHLVIGIIDEIARKPVRQVKRRQPATTIPATQVPKDQSTLPFASPPPPAAAAPSSSQPAAPGPSRSPGKVWASQEEWKAHQRKVEAAKKTAAKNKGKKAAATTPSSPKRSKTVGSPPATPKKQKGLAAFAGFATSPKKPAATTEPADETATVGSSSTAAPAPAASPTGPSIEARPHAFYMSDAKTRLFNSIPPVEDQRAGRLQLQIYRRLFDGLCLGVVERAMGSKWKQGVVTYSSAAALAADNDRFLRLDPHAQPMHFAHLFASLDLNPERQLSDAFLDDSKELLEDVDLSMLSLDHDGSPTAATSASKLATLNDVVRLVDATILELIRAAHRDAGRPLSPDQPLGAHHAAALHSELSLVYRLQERRGKWTRNKRPTPKKKVSNTAATAYHVSDDEDDQELRLAIQLSLEGQAGSLPESETARRDTDTADGLRTLAVPSSPPRRRSGRLAGRNKGASDPRPSQDLATLDPLAAAATAAVASAKASAQAARPVTPPPPSSSQSSKRSRSKTSSNASRLIGASHFYHSPAQITAHLSSVLDFWLGHRPAIGVSEDHSWRCKGCEFHDGCEWRAAKGEEKRQWAIDRWAEKRDQERAREGQRNGLESSGGDDDEDGEEVDEDDEDAALWRSFGGGGEGDGLFDDGTGDLDEEDLALLDAMEAQHQSATESGGGGTAEGDASEPTVLP